MRPKWAVRHKHEIAKFSNREYLQSPRTIRDDKIIGFHSILHEPKQQWEGRCSRLWECAQERSSRAVTDIFKPREKAWKRESPSLVHRKPHRRSTLLPRCTAPRMTLLWAGGRSSRYCETKRCSSEKEACPCSADKDIRCFVYVTLMVNRH